MSDDGQHNGLYWKVANAGPQSPIGPLVASAAADGYSKNQNGTRAPYHGYYYRILTRQERIPVAKRKVTSPTEG